jgi:hypothetical protein
VESIKALEVRKLLFGDKDISSSPPLPTTQKFVLAHTLLPQTAHEFRCSGLYDAFWASPPAFRERVVDSFKRVAKGEGGLPMMVERGIWEQLGVELVEK